MASRIVEAAKAERTGPGKILLTIITPGQGSSGYYPEETIRRAAAEKAFPKGTFGFVNHATESEGNERPEGDLEKLIWVTLEDAYVRDGALVAETRVLSRYRQFIEDVHEDIGASIRAAAEVRDTKDGRIIERIIPNVFNSVDAVTRAGRGGGIAEIIESAVDQVSEVTADDIDMYLRLAVRDTHSDPEADVYAWQRDYDDTYVYFGMSGRTWRQTYTRDGVNVALTGEPEEVLPRREYDPITKESGGNLAEKLAAAVTPHLQIPNTESTAKPAVQKTSSPVPAEETKKSTKEINMAEIAEERLQLLEESHGRVPALEAKVTEAEDRAEKAERRAAIAESTVRARDFAKKIVTSANSELSESVVARIVDASTATIPLTESLQLDTDALTESVNKARESEETYLAQLAKENGIGQVRGIGDTKSIEVAEASSADIANELKGL